MNKIIVPTGYMGSGSSAVTDLISEYKDCSNKYKSFEYVFLHMPSGLFDLEDKLLLGNNALRSDEAIREFKCQQYKLYNKKFWWVGNYKKVIGPGFKEEVDKYINDLVQFNYNAYWYMHEEVNTKMFLKLLLRKPLKLIIPNYFKGKKVLKYKDGVVISFPKKEEFYEKSKKYIYNVLNLIVRDEKENTNVILDQLLLPFNLYRIDNYFNDDLRVIVVERDPRDVFILNKYIWPSRELTVPFPTDVNEFCRYYKLMRESEHQTSSTKVLRIHFEDLIYNYEDEKKKIEKFLGFDSSDHVTPKKRFDPDISIKNTQLFYDKYQEEAKIIEKELSKYLYKFPYKLENNVEKTVEFE